MPWNLTKEDVERIAIGAGILGTGGGGNPHRGQIRAQMQVDCGNTMTVVDLDELDDDALVVPMGGIGAPTIGLEKLGRGDEGKVAVERMQELLGVTVAATAPIEIGGANSFAPLIAGALLGKPTVNVDGMGRAFPKGSMISYYFDGQAPSPVVMVDSKHQTLIIRDVPDTDSMERIARAACVQLGGSAMVANAPITVRRLRETGIPDTMSLAFTVGDRVLKAQREGGNPIEAICEATRGRILFRGKISDVDRRFERGYNFGRLILSGLNDFSGSTAKIDLQNEYLICNVDDEVKAIVPDLITLVDSERGTPVTTEVVRYGLRVTVIGMPAPPQLTTPQAMQHVGPKAFGYELAYTPLDVLSTV
jgi:uncharacterized protein